MAIHCSFLQCGKQRWRTLIEGLFRSRHKCWYQVQATEIKSLGRSINTACFQSRMSLEIKTLLSYKMFHRYERTNYTITNLLQYSNTLELNQLTASRYFYPLKKRPAQYGIAIFCFFFLSYFFFSRKVQK